MTARNPEQIDNALDRSEQILAQQSIALDRLTVLVAEIGLNTQEIGVNTRRRLQQHDLELDDHDERTEALERLMQSNDARHQEHEKTIGELKEIQTDVKSMLAILMTRFSGESPG